MLPFLDGGDDAAEVPGHEKALEENKKGYEGQKPFGWRENLETRRVAP